MLASESDALRPSIGPLDHRSWLEDVASQVVDVGWWAGFWKIVIAKVKKGARFVKKKRKYMLAKSKIMLLLIFELKPNLKSTRLPPVAERLDDDVLPSAAHRRDFVVDGTQSRVMQMQID